MSDHRDTFDDEDLDNITPEEQAAADALLRALDGPPDPNADEDLRLLYELREAGREARRQAAALGLPPPGPDILVAPPLSAAAKERIFRKAMTELARRDAATGRGAEARTATAPA